MKRIGIWIIWMEIKAILLGLIVLENTQFHTLVGHWLFAAIV